ncbi:uncharacterized protein K441DRAFT_19893 [Cenococcum geophilum 1.58]|uniref:Uncharacterized protein n=1 Tax=Cenococcum geophilum 1.58 TaxID=794803 RepID=A0ACC8EL66_9PEZI|nr:hypothetical protein K441DRAFT_19893 [Cenococcum geophilum 1.58]
MQDTSVTTLQAGVSPEDMDGLPLSDASSSEDKGLQMSTGRGTNMPRQLGSYSANELPSYLHYCAAALVPIVTAGLVALFLTRFTALSCTPGA